jgi:hypothetical protein
MWTLPLSGKLAVVSPGVPALHGIPDAAHAGPKDSGDDVICVRKE